MSSGRKYKYLSNLKDIDSYYIDCLKQDRVDNFNDYLIEKLVEVTDSHISNNDAKTRLLTKTSKWMTRSFLFAAVVIFFYLASTPIERIFLNQNHSTKTKSNIQMKHQDKPQLPNNTPATLPEVKPDSPKLVPPPLRILEERSDNTPLKTKSND